MRQRLEHMKGRHEEIVESMTKGEVPVREMGSVGKELGRLEAVLDLQAKVEEKAAEIQDLEEVMQATNAGGAEADREMHGIAKEEHADCTAALEKLRLDLTSLLLPRDEGDSKNALLEVRSGSGGDEAAAFAKELFEMYRRFAELKGWKFEGMTCSSIDAGGYREASASIRGEDVYGSLKFENGVHRVQRVPSNSPRLHTSAASVVVMMEAEEMDLKLEQSDLRFEAFRASGAGGQHVNTTESAVRITHVPTGITASIQDERSQHSNKEKALKVLRSRVFEVRRDEIARKEAAVRASAVGSGDRSERIRTYNFPQDRITDHRANYSRHGWEAMMRGEMLGDFLEAMRDKTQSEQLKAAGLQQKQQ
ncbi:conserved unknown protein [Ectocarpus siliculosus]|uniref:Prokaryotic-type class I peptide chain release factors domain-containing protein n=1 Tax=Ectocarpus siliculosus TaxID=2880 RepID=D8LBL0_ECTSI|nr:conserved unknown protein [Ectocarpus siliculosus]|eukprot:CBN76719.1 conserved unknown protein [Ectocarpus siliculosus]